MAIFLVIYGIFLLIWLTWSLIVTYHLNKFKFPDKTAKIYLMSFWLFSILILFISLVVIAQADWRTTPDFFMILGV